MARRRPVNRWLRALLGIAVPNGLWALLLWVTIRLNEDDPDNSGTLTLTMFVLIPLLMGLASAFLLAGQPASTNAAVTYCVVNAALALGICYLFMAKG